MKTVIVRPERCVGCLQCRLACAVEHSQTKELVAALGEAWRPVARIAVYPGGVHLSFPNKCRHCEPAPCQAVCIAGAISRNPARGTTDIDPARCINCGMCAMACPFGVLTYAPTPKAPERRAVALKCDHCPERQAQGRPPACVEACKVGALTWGEPAEEMAAKGRFLAQAYFAASRGVAESPEPEMIRLWRQLG